MNPTSSPRTLERNNRVLVIDDNVAIHSDIRKILCPPVAESLPHLQALEDELFGDTRPVDQAGTPCTGRAMPTFVVDSAYQGQDGLELVKKALAEGKPYGMAFVDMRMPPGWDGIETTLELWKVVPDLQIVICTAYSDYSWDELLGKIDASDRLVILKKPFDTIEVFQLANALTAKWNLLQQARAQADELEMRVHDRTVELESSNALLQDEIGRRVFTEFDLKRAKDAAETADRAKSAFLANMSHEIRTPMNGVLGMANLLLATPLNQEQHDLALTLCQSGESLLTIINDILDFSKIEAGRLELENIDFDLAEHLEMALDLHAESAARKRVELVMNLAPDVPREVRGDPGRLRQILLNLIGNAIKFTAQGEVVLTVSVEQSWPHQFKLRFAVKDTGIGIPPWVQEKLFQPFIQADSSTTRQFGGTGLGLVICKRLAELMGGAIGVESVMENGSTFWFTAELRHASRPIPKPAIPLPNLEGKKVLIVDDNATNRSLLAHLCTAWKINYRAVEGVDVALVEIRNAITEGQPFDLVITDHHMPERDGLDLASTINGDPSLRNPVVVLLTSRGERLPQADLDAYQLAACELKPIHAKNLHEMMARVLATPRPGGDGLNGHAASGGGEAVAVASPIPPFREQPVARGNTPILVAEDNLVNQKVTLLQLRNLGYTADVAHNGLEALEALRTKRYSLVLMDAQMPVMDGIEATRRIRQLQAAGEPSIPASLPIIAMTANAMAGDRETYLAAGMDDYLAKPVKSGDLREMLDRYLGEPQVHEPAAVGN
jgi:two-component system sensor histidine kinase/response regulator